MNVDRTGTFRARLLEKGITKTKEKGYPQLVGRVQLIELYDSKENKWFDTEDWDMETNFFSCLYGVKKGQSSPTPTLGHEQAMKVFEWDGESLAELDKADHIGLEFQVRIGENTYEGAKSPFQVDWIDVYDADPVYTLRKLDAKEVKDLDAQFSNITPSTKKAKSVKKPASKKPTAPKTSKKTTADMTPAEKKATMKARSERIKQEVARKKQEEKAKAAAPKKPTAPPPPDDNTPPLPEATEEITKAQAWEKIYEMRDPTINDETVMELWKSAIEEVGGEGCKSADLDGKQWCQVKDIVLADCGKF